MGGWFILVATVLEQEDEHTDREGVAQGAAFMTIILMVMFALASMWVSDTIDSMVWKRKQKKGNE